MAITLADFTKIWASTSPLTPYSFSDSNYQEGWNFIGGTPPARQMWDSIQKQNDEKLKYIVDNFLPLSGGTMTGDITLDGGAIVGNPLTLTADDGNGNTNNLVVNADGTMSLDGNDITPQIKTAKSGNSISVPNNTFKTLVDFNLGIGTWLVIGSAEFANNATGYRSLWFSDREDGLWITTSALTQTGSYSGGSLFIQVSYILNVSSPKTYYLVGRQASGGNLNVSGGVEVIRLSSIA